MLTPVDTYLKASKRNPYGDFYVVLLNVNYFPVHLDSGMYYKINVLVTARRRYGRR